MENEIIDFYSEKQMRQYSVFRKPKSGGDIGRNLISLVHYKGLKSRHERFDQMRKKHLALSRRCAVEKEVYEVANAYDTLICGSDQIWNTEARDYSDAYFMTGVEKKKISYAASFGSHIESINKDKVQKNISGFAHISVREKAGKEFLKNLLPDKNVELVCDPTLLLPKTEYSKLMGKENVKEPYIFLYADDYYGKEGFKAVHEYLVNGGKSCMAGFVLKNTLSDNGGVTRGICKMDDQNNLTEVVETKNIVKTTTGAEADGVDVDVDSLVSMNMWGLTPEFLDVLEKGFKEFFEKEVSGNPQKAEYLIPIFIGELLEQGKMSVKVLKTNDTWYGMTYHEDVAAVKGSFKEMLENGVYKADLFSDL